MMNIGSFFKIYGSKLLRRFFNTTVSYQKPFYNFFYYTKKGWFTKHKRALLSYRPLPVWLQAKTTWSSVGDVHDILYALSMLGYKTDIVDSGDTAFIPQKKYDLFIGHEGKNFKNIADQLPKQTTTIFYPMSAYWKFQNNEEENRINDLQKRHGVKIHAERFILASEDYALNNADGVILLSNKRGKHTYPNPHNILTLASASYTHGFYDLEQKNFSAAQNNFLFLSGSGNVHKGLDLLLDSFIGLPDKHLYICTKLEPDFKELYYRELFETPNIHYIGHIKIYTQQFYDLISKCNYIVFPSCSEGSPGSVIDSMFQGLIPIVSLNAHIDIEEVGFVLEPCTIETIKRIISEVASRSENWYKEQSIKVRAYALQNFSQELYRKKLQEHIQTIIHHKHQVMNSLN